MSHVETTDLRPDVPCLRRRRWRICLGLALLLFILTLVVIYSFFTYWMDRALREAMAEADRDSPEGWQLEDIEARRDQVPDEENAALVVMKVKSLLPANWPKDVATPADGADAPLMSEPWYERFHDLPPQVQLDADLLRSLRESLQRVEPARTQARKLIGMTRGRFPLEWQKQLLVWKRLDSEDAGTAVNLLHYETALAAQDGDADGAMAFVRGLVGAARSIGDEPFIRSALMRLGCNASAVVALERALAQGEPSARELVALQALLEKEAAEPLLIQMVRGERAGMQQLLLSLRDGEARLSQLAGANGAFEKAWVEFSRPALVRRSHAHTLRLLNEYVEISKLPLDKQPPAMRKLENKVRQAKLHYDVVTALLMPAIIRPSEVYRRGVGNLRCAAVAVALERYRREDGDWPSTLDALVPKYLTAVPTDPQDGKPLRFKRRPDGVVVYWLGPDGTDDGGKLYRHKSISMGTDQGFQLWDVKQRRQPAREVLPLPSAETINPMEG